MTATVNRPHRVSSAVAVAREQLAAVTEVPLWSMGPDETTTTLTELAALAAQVAELQARTLVHADRAELPALTGATSTANWYAHHTHTTRPAAHRTMRLARALDDHDLTRDALAAGTLHTDQAHVILDAVADLPPDFDPALVADAEAHLIEQARHFDAKALKHLGQAILQVIAPDLADAHLAALLEKEERDAAAGTRLTLWDDGHGKTHGKFTLDGLTGAMLKKALFAFAAPKHRASQGPLTERRPTPERLGQAFTELIQRYPTKRLPKAGGMNATIVVLMPLDTIMGDLKAAQLDTGGYLSAGAARRLACAAGIYPAVLGTHSEVLDLGRKARFHTVPQRIAKTIEARGCQIEGCDWPPAMTHLHHPKRWADGGHTNHDAIMICPPHHTRAHDPRYEFEKLPTGKYRFHRRS